MEQSYGKMLARGKYVHEIVHHKVAPIHQQKYQDLIAIEYQKIAADASNSIHLVGSWKCEIGEPDLFVHIWEYKGYAGYDKTRSQLALSPEFNTFQGEVGSLITTRRNDLMQEFSFWPTASPRNLGGIFELRSYNLQPGKLLEWEAHWRKGLEARRNVMEGVGAWFTQIGKLNTVYHLWQFGNLRERQLSREKSWEIPGWSDTVHKTVPLIAQMHSNILIPLPWSPVR